MRGERDAGTLAPPRVDTPIVIPVEQSVLVVPVRTRLAPIAAFAAQSIPRTLWAIDKRGVSCVQAARL